MVAADPGGGTARNSCCASTRRRSASGDCSKRGPLSPDGSQLPPDLHNSRMAFQNPAELTFPFASRENSLVDQKARRMARGGGDVFQQFYDAGAEGYDLLLGGSRDISRHHCCGQPD